MCRDLGLRLKSLVIFRNLLGGKVFSRLLALLGEVKDNGELAMRWGEFAAALYEEGGDLGLYVLRAVTEDENLYTRRFVRGENTALFDAQLQNELSVLSAAAAFDGEELRRQSGLTFLARWENTPVNLAAEYAQRMENAGKTGFGVFAQYHMFILDDAGKLLPIRHPDPQKLCELYGYERERGLIIANTKAFLEGKPANNVLLYGDAGTGKSSTVKAVANEFYPEGLRLVELKKTQLYLIQSLMDDLTANPLKFIFFIDDLTFSSDDRDFCALKAILEGGVSGRGSNILIYATSNHRHLVKETMEDRQGNEISAADKRQELISLSARFGLTVTFLRPERELYERIVCALAEERGIALDRETLLVRAEAHAIRNGGRNPRTAKQFIDLLQSGVE